jgi:hypothetical protein
MKLIEGQMLSSFSHVLYWHAQIISGAYKARNIQKGDEATKGWRNLTDEEKLEDSFNAMQAHINRIYECTDYLPTSKDLK